MFPVEDIMSKAVRNTVVYIFCGLWHNFLLGTVIKKLSPFFMFSDPSLSLTPVSRSIRKCTSSLSALMRRSDNMCGSHSRTFPPAPPSLIIVKAKASHPSVLAFPSHFWTHLGALSALPRKSFFWYPLGVCVALSVLPFGPNFSGRTIPFQLKDYKADVCLEVYLLSHIKNV